MMKNKRILITGGRGQLAQEFIRSLKKNGSNYIAPSKDQLDITDHGQTQAIIKDYSPKIIINCAAYNFVDMAEDEKDKAFKVNRDAVAQLAEVCKKRGILLVHFSTDYVFDGKKGDLYIEEDTPNPLNIYGTSKWEGEQRIKRCLEEYLIFRVSWVFGEGKMNFIYKLSQWAEKNRVLKIVSDEISIPTYTEDIVRVVLSAIERNLRGLYHLTSSGSCSRCDYTKYYLKKTGASREIIPVKSREFPAKAVRPLFSAMSNRKISGELGITIPSWQDAVGRFIERRAKGEVCMSSTANGGNYNNEK